MQEFLKFQHKESLSENDFIITSCNQEAWELVQSFNKWQENFCAIYGPEACGKTHLANIFHTKAKAKKIKDLLHTASDYQMTAGNGSKEYFVIDDIDELLTDSKCEANSEEALFHLLNTIRNDGNMLLITCKTHPAHIGVKLPDLRSRLAAFNAVEIKNPDDEMLEIMLHKLFSDRQLIIPKEVAKYIMLRCRRTFADIQNIVSSIDNLSMREKRNITIPLVRKLFENNDIRATR